MTHLFIIAGAPGAGKSWVCRDLPNSVYVPHDRTPRSKMHGVLEESLKGTLPVVVDPTVRVSNTLREFPQGRLLVVVEPEEVVKERLAARGGSYTESVGRRIKRMLSLARKAEFSGTSTEVRAYLLNKLLEYRDRQGAAATA